jgi:hypothetical protein
MLEIARQNSGYIKLKQRNVDIVFLTRAINDLWQFIPAKKALNWFLLQIFPAKSNWVWMRENLSAFS